MQRNTVAKWVLAFTGAFVAAGAQAQIVVTGDLINVGTNNSNGAGSSSTVINGHYNVCSANNFMCNLLGQQNIAGRSVNSLGSLNNLADYTTNLGTGNDLLGKFSTGLGYGVRTEVGAEGSVALGSGSVATRPAEISVGTPSYLRTITNVKASTEFTSAATVGQVAALGQSTAQGLSDVRNYVSTVDQRLSNEIREVNDRISGQVRDSDRATATAIAMANAQPGESLEPGQTGFGMALGSFGGQGAAAFVFQKKVTGLFNGDTPVIRGSFATAGQGAKGGFAVAAS